MLSILMRLKIKKDKSFQKEYVKTLAEAQEMAEAMVSSLQKGSTSSGGGSDQFLPNRQLIFFPPVFIFCYPREWKIFGFTSYPFFYEQKL